MRDSRTIAAKILCTLLILTSMASLFLPWHIITMNGHMGSYFWLVVFGPVLYSILGMILFAILGLSLLALGVYAIRYLLQGDFKPVSLFRNIALATAVVFLLATLMSDELSFPIDILLRDILCIGFWLCPASALAAWLCARLLPRREKTEQ